MNNIRVIFFCVLAGLMTSAHAQSTSNSVVRFRFAHGPIFFGDVDVELFDQDKPVTVSNFLAYVQSGRYDNGILNRLIPGFVVQGGEYVVANPYSPQPFEFVGRIPTFPEITNEYHVGTVRSNVFGTLGMAKVDGDPNSANSAWFINLGDNSSNLDHQNGGFTVFGHVIAGERVLQTFNILYEGRGIANMTNALYLSLGCSPLYRFPGGDFTFFPELPVGYTGVGCINYNDLFTTQMIMLSGPDVLGPKVTITNPKANVSLTNDTITVSGTAIDNSGAVASVRVYLNTNAPVLASGTNAWSLTLSNLAPGTNTLLVEASDPSGNRSRTAISFFHSVRMPIDLAILGAGSVAGHTNGQLYELTRIYTLTAKPAPGNLFVSWTGTFAQASAIMKFQMDTNLQFTAVFATNLFPTVKGVYNGLFHDTNQVAPESSGGLTLTLGDFGSYSAKLSMNGRTYKMTGTFSPDGTETNLVLLSDTVAVRFLMALDLAGGSDQITGIVTNLPASFVAVPLWSANLSMDRAVFSTLRPAPFAGKYTVIIPTDTNSPPGPTGDGFAALKVDVKGGVTLSGLLADNTKLSVKAVVSKNGELPLFVPLYKGKGLLVSRLVFANQPDTDCGGLLSWFRGTEPTAKYYPRGFTNQVNAEGSIYAAPTTNPVIELANNIIGFTNGNLAADFANTITLGANNKFTNGSTNKMTLTLVKSTGLLNGTVTPPGATRALPIKAAVLQKQNRGAGMLIGTDKTSRVLLGP